MCEWTTDDQAAYAEMHIDLYVEAAAAAGPTLSAAIRADLGQYVTETHDGGPIPPVDTAIAMRNLMVDLYHYVDGIGACPVDVLEAAQHEQRTITVNTAGVIPALGSDGRTAAAIAALAAVLAYGEAHGVDTNAAGIDAFMFWAEEADAERIQRIRERRKA